MGDLSVIRKFKQEDIEQLVDIYMETYRQAPWNEEWSKEFAGQRISDLTISPISAGYVICDEKGFVVGGLFGRRTVFINSVELFIDELFISPKAQRSGYGRRMIDYVSDNLKKEGYSCLVLNTERGYPSERFYKKIGFDQKESVIFMYKNI